MTMTKTYYLGNDDQWWIVIVNGLSPDGQWNVTASRLVRGVPIDEAAELTREIEAHCPAADPLAVRSIAELDVFTPAGMPAYEWSN